jgi:hypothetical protein
MRQVRKPLSLILAVLMALTSCSVMFSAFSFTADAANLNTSAVNNASSYLTASGNYTLAKDKYTYNGKTGSVQVLAAADAVYNYVRSDGTGTSKSSASEMNAMKNAVSSNSAKQAVEYLADPNPSNAQVYAQSSKLHDTGNTGWKSSSSWSDSYYGAYPSLSSVTKTVVINLDLADYLYNNTSYKTISDIPSSFATTYTYTYVNSVAHSRDHSGSWSQGMWWWKEYQWNWNTYSWHYFANSSAFSKVSSNNNTTAKTDLQNISNFYNSYVTLSTKDLLDGVEAGTINITELANQATSYVNILTSTYSSQVADKFIGSGSLAKLQEFAKKATLVNNAVQSKKYIDALEDYNSQYKALNPSEDSYTKSGYDSNLLDTLFANTNSVYSSLTSIYSDEVKAILKEAYGGNYSDYIPTADENKASLTSTYYKYHIYVARNAVESLYTENKDYAESLKQSVLDSDKTEDAKPKISKADSDALRAVNTQLDAARSALAEYSAKAPNEYKELVSDYTVDGDKFENISNKFNSIVDALIATREEETDFEGYYITDGVKDFLFNGGGEYSNDEILKKYDTVEEEYNKIVKTYKEFASETYFKENPDVLNAAYSINYPNADGATEKMLLQDAVKIYMDGLKKQIIARNDAQHELVEKYLTDPYQTTVSWNNFAGLETALNRIDSNLCEYVKNKGWDNKYKSICDSESNLKAQVKTFLENAKNYTKTTYRDSNGVYTTRYAGYQDGKGYENDIARDGEDDNYVVDEDSVNETVVKIDKFITSSDFAKLASLKDKEGNSISNLSDYIETMLSENLFTNDMINTLVGSLFPMIVDQVSNLINNLLNMGIEGLGAPRNGGVASYYLDQPINQGAAGFTLKNIYGYIEIYANGQKGTATIKQILDSLNVYAYPSSFASSLPSKYSAVKAALNNCGDDWHKLVGADGKTKLTFDWGVTDYNSFVSAMGDVFNSVLPILRTALLGTSYSKNVNNIAYVSAENMTINYTGWFGSSSSINISFSAMASANISLSLDKPLYQNMWIPVMEALGIADDGYKFTNLSQNASASEIVSALFSPLLKLIDQLKTSPVEKLCSMIPQFAYFVSTNALQKLLNDVNLNVKVKASVSNMSGVKVLGIDISGIAQNIVNNNVLSSPIAVTVNAGSLINISDLLGVDITDFNALIAFVLDKVGVNLSLPIMNVGEVITCSDYTENAPSQRPSGKRTKLTADKADVFYLLLRYVVNAAGDENFINSLLKLIGNATGAGTENKDLSGILDKVMANVKGKPLDALAALVELFVPNEETDKTSKYAPMEYDWYKSKYDDDTTVASKVYISNEYYGKNWTKQTAQTVVDNSSDLVKEIAKLAGTDDLDLENIINTSIRGIFTSRALASVISVLSNLGKTLSKQENIVEVLKDDTGIDLLAWNKAFSSVFPSEDEDGNKTYPADGATADYIYNGHTVTVSYSESKLSDGGNYKLSFDGKEMTTGDKDTFLGIFTSVFAPAAPIFSFLLSSKDLTLLSDAVTIKGFNGYTNSVVYIFKAIGMTDVMSDADYQAMAEADPVNAFNTLSKQLFDYIYSLTEGNVIKNILKITPSIVYFIESNGLAASIHNLIMPALVLLDTVRPIFDLDVDSVFSVVLTELLKESTDENGKTLPINTSLDADGLVSYIIGDNEAGLTPDYDVSISNLRLEDILRIADKFLGTDFASSELISYGADALCAGQNKLESKDDSLVPDEADTLTILVSTLIETLRHKNAEGVSNADKVLGFIDKYNLVDTSKLGDNVTLTGIYDAADKILSEKTKLEYDNVNWLYMYTDADIDSFSSSDFKDNMESAKDSYVFLQYNNNWNKETAENADKLIQDLLKTYKVNDSGDTVGTLIENVLKDKVYSKDVFVSVVKAIFDLLSDYNAVLADTALTALGVDCQGFFGRYAKKDSEGNFEKNENGAYIFDDASFDNVTITDKASFVSELEEVLKPIDKVLSYILFGDSYEMFTASSKDDSGSYTYDTLLTISGAEIYDNSLVCILEALELDEGDTSTDTGIHPASYYYDADKGEYAGAKAVTDAVSALLDKADEIAEDPLTNVMPVLLNVIYFTDAGGFDTAVKNALKYTDAVAEKVLPTIGRTEKTSLELIKTLIKDKLDLSKVDNELVKSLVEKIENADSFDGFFSFSTLFGILSDVYSINVQPDVINLISKFYLGRLEKYTSANGKTAMKMVFADGDTGDGTRADFETYILSVVFDVLKDKNNIEAIKKLAGSEDASKILDSLYNVLKLDEDSVSYQKFDWILTDIADTDKVTTAVKTSKKYADPYASGYWTREMAENVVKVLPRFVGNLVCLLGIEIEGKPTDSVSDIVTELVNGKVYTKENLQKILDAIQNQVIARIKEKLSQDEYKQVCDILKSSLGVDLSKYETMTIEGDVNDRKSFEAGLDMILAPLTSVIDSILNGKSLRFFNDCTGDIIVIPGSMGYKLGVIPLLEALGCENIPTVEDVASSFNTAVETQDDSDRYAAVNKVLDPLFDKVDELEKDPVNTLQAILPEVIYYINSNGLDTTLHNLLASVQAVLDAVEPLTGKIDLEEEIKINGTPVKDFTADFDSIVKILLKNVETDSGVELSALALDAINELTTGKVVSYESVNGDTSQKYYKMVYAKGSEADQFTSIARILIDFMSNDENRAGVKKLIKKYINDEKTYGYVCATLDTLAKYAADDPSFGKDLYTIYQLFLASEDAIDQTDLAYHDVNNTWAFMMKMMETSSEPSLKLLEGFINKFLNENVSPDIADKDHIVAPNGFVKFFRAWADIFSTIIKLLKRIFNR